MPTIVNLRLNADGDLDITGGRLVLSYDEEGIVQAVECRLRLLKGELFHDEEEGTPWYQEILGVKQPNIPAIREAFRRRIRGTKGIASVDSIVLTFDRAARRLDVAWRATADTGLLIDTTTVL